jgi:hypothetical protein
MELQDAVDSIRRFVDHGIPTGGFLRAVLANDLMEAVGRADESSLVNLADICRYVYNDIPANAHGSYERIDLYLAQKHKERAEARG